MKVERVQHVSVLRPSGEDARATAVQFYQDVLGCEEIPKPRTLSHIDTTWFRCGDDEIHLLATGQAEPVPENGGHFCLAVDDLDSMRRRLTDAGFQCRGATPIPGRPRFFTRDPFGNEIEITSIDGDERHAS